MNLKVLLLLLILAFASTLAKADDYYWIGANGDWNQVSNWRIGGTSGAVASSVPSSADNVFFTTPTLHTITLTSNVSCNNITVTGVSRFNAASEFNIQIYGSAVFNSTTTLQNRTGVRLNFMSNSIATLTANGMPDWYHIQISKEGGELTIKDRIRFEYFDFNSGKVVFTPGSESDLLRFRSGMVNTPSPYGVRNGTLSVDANRELVLNNATLKVREWFYNGVNAKLDAGTSTIKFLETANITGHFYATTKHLYNRVTITNKSSGYGGNTETFGLSAKYFKFEAEDIPINNPIVRLYGMVGDTIQIGKVETNVRIDLQYAKVDSAVYSSIYSTMVLFRSTIKNAYLEGSGAFQDFAHVDTLALSYGQYYSFNQNQKYQIFDNFKLIGDPCQGAITLESGNTNVANMAEFIKTSGSLDIQFGRIVNIKTSGGATFNCAGFDANSRGWNFTNYVAIGKDLYRIGGGMYRYWNDPTAWSLTSGGVPANCVPSIHDNVFFDDLSGLTNSSPSNNNRRIRMRSGIKAYVKDMTIRVSESTYTPVFHMEASRGIDIYGSFEGALGFSFTGVALQSSDTVRFLSPNAGNTITLNGSQLPRMLFDNPTGKWILQDSLTANNIVVFKSGTLNTNNHGIRFEQFISEGDGIRSIILGSSSVWPNINNNTGWLYRGTNMTLDAGTSIMQLRNNHMSTDSTLRYNRVIMYPSNNDLTLTNVSAKYLGVDINPTALARRVYIQGRGLIDSLDCGRLAYFQSGSMTIKNALFRGETKFGNSNIFDTITFADARANWFLQNTTQKIRSKAYSNSTGCEGYSTFRATANLSNNQLPTVTAKIEIPPTETFVINGAYMQWMEGVGTGTYNIAGDDLGSNVNWNFTNPTSRDIYWVGGSGNWSDRDHWSATSGGLGGYCLPTDYDNVFFDINSNIDPSAELIITVAGGKCNDMTWSGVQGITKKIISTNALSIFGSVVLQTDVEYLMKYMAFYALENFTEQTLKTNGATIQGAVIFGSRIYNSSNQHIASGGKVRLLDDLRVWSVDIPTSPTTSIRAAGQIIVDGILDTDGHNIETRMYFGRERSTSYWRNSTITGWYWGLDDATYFGFHNSATGYTDSANVIMNTDFGLAELYLRNLDTLVLNNYHIDRYTNIRNSGTINFIDIHTGINTQIHGTITSKKIIARNGLRTSGRIIADSLLIGRGVYYFWGDANKKSTIGLIEDFDGMCSDIRSVLGTSGTGYINVTDVGLTKTIFQNMTFDGAGAPYNVTGEDKGGNTGLNFTSVGIVDMYLVSDTSVVYWDNPNVWSYTSGGPSAGCTPTKWNNVIVDDNSYIKNPATTLQLRTGLTTQQTECNNFTSTRNTGIFQMHGENTSARQSLYIHGSIDFNDKSQMLMYNGNSPLYLYASSPQTLKFKGYINSKIIFQPLTTNGSWDLLSDLIIDTTQNRDILIRGGDIRLNGYKLAVTRLWDEDNTTRNYSIDVDNSTISVNQYLLLNGTTHNTKTAYWYLTNRHMHSYLRVNPLNGGFDKIIFNILYNANSNLTSATIHKKTVANEVIVNTNITGHYRLHIADTIDVKSIKINKLNANARFRGIQIHKASNIGNIDAIATCLEFNLYGDSKIGTIRTDAQNVIMENNNEIGSFHTTAKSIIMNGDNIFDTFSIAQNAPIVTLATGTNQTIKKEVYISGSPCYLTTFKSSVTGSMASLTMPRPMTVDFMILSNIKAQSYDGTPGAILTAERNSTESATTQNINFITLPKTIVGLGEDKDVCFKSFPYTISSEGFFGGLASTYVWKKGNTTLGTSKNLLITEPGTYSVKMDYDPEYSCVQHDTVTILRDNPISFVTSFDTLRPVCHKDSMLLTINYPTGANLKYSVQDTSNHSNLILQTSNVFNNIKAGTYYIIVDSLNCLSDSILITISEPFRAGIPNDIENVNDTAICLGSSIILQPQTDIGKNPLFKWYSDENLTNQITVGVDANGYFTTPILIADTTFYVTLISDTICENLPNNAKSVVITMKTQDCIKANDDTTYVFTCDSVITNVVINDDYFAGYSININISDGMPSKGNLEVKDEKIIYRNTSCNNQVDRYKYSICSQYLCDTATVTVAILRKPEIILLSTCGYSIDLFLDVTYNNVIWQYSTDNSEGSWVDITECVNEKCTRTKSGFYKVKINFKGLETYTNVIELEIKERLIHNKIWYDTTVR